MDKKTIIAVVLAVAIVGIGMFIQYRFFGGNETTDVPEEQIQTSDETVTDSNTLSDVDYNESSVFHAVGDSPSSMNITVNNGVIKAVINTRGAVVESFQLLNHLEKDGTPVDMIFDFGTDQDTFQILPGGINASPIEDTFFYEKDSTGLVHTFSRSFTVTLDDGMESEPFEMIKQYVFYPEEYLFEIKVTFKNSVNEALPFGDTTAYTMHFGPQIGPEFTRLDKRGRVEFRRYFTYFAGKKRPAKVKEDEIFAVEDRVSWAGISGKYFSLIAIPDETAYNISFSAIPEDNIPNASELFLSRPKIDSSQNTDVFRFYIGPNVKNELSKYNDPEKNDSGLYDLDLDKIVDGSALLGWLEAPLKWILELFYKLVGNWGVAIILLTIVIKALLFPITHKSYESTSKMQAIQPKVKELQEKYKDNPQKMNKEMADLYKKEGVNPMGGCLPMILQMPILIALFGVLNKYFELRGAVFIPGWINDLSIPDTIVTFARAIPIFRYELSEIHLLPIIYLVIQIFTTIVTQGPSAKAQGNNMQTKMMTYGMPIMFFFIFYEMPSGLLIYWTMTNLLTLIQQLITNKLKKGKEAKS